MKAQSEKKIININNDSDVLSFAEEEEEKYHAQSQNFSPKGSSS
jgi:hypothetical protein